MPLHDKTRLDRLARRKRRYDQLHGYIPTDEHLREEARAEQADDETIQDIDRTLKIYTDTGLESL
jgi:hypothetical protein